MHQGHRAVLIQAPTGSGKTLLTAYMIKKAMFKDMRAWFIVHRRELIKQSVDAFNLCEIKHGLIASGMPANKSRNIQIASIQTLIKRHNQYQAPNLIAWDESHHIRARSWQRLFELYPETFHIGLTATPQRMDGSGLGTCFSKMVSGPTVEWLIDNGYLAKYKLFAPTTINLSGVHSRMGDYVQSELASILDRPTITGDAINHYRKHCGGMQAVAFCVSIEHSKHVAEQFNSCGIKAQHVDGKTKTLDRDNIIQSFRRGSIKVLTNVDLFGEGFDLPTLEVSILLRPTKSLAVYLQQCGRCLRPSPGKEYAIILDHANCSAMHGLPCDHREWSLNSAPRKGRGEPSVVHIKGCPRCFAVARATHDICPECGYVYDKKPREVDHVDGELQEVDVRAVKDMRLVEQGNCHTFEDLVELGRKRKYKRPYLWAKHVWNSRKRRQMQSQE